MSLMQQALWWVAVLTGCSQTVVFTLPATETLGVLVYSSGRPSLECNVTPGSSQQQKLAAWLSQNTEGWSATPVTYAPSLSITGSNFSINFLGGSAILNYERGQYSHPIKPNEYEFLSCSNRTQPGVQADAAAQRGLT